MILADVGNLFQALLGAIIFSLFASTVYIFNDITDREADRAHPKKKERPIASGAISVQTARIASICLFLISSISAYFLSPLFLFYCLLYLVINFMYSMYFKHIVIFDVMLLASFYVIRLYAGSSLVEIHVISPWLVMTTSFLATCPRSP